MTETNIEAFKAFIAEHGEAPDVKAVIESLPLVEQLKKSQAGSDRQVSALRQELEDVKLKAQIVDLLMNALTGNMNLSIFMDFTRKNRNDHH